MALSPATVSAAARVALAVRHHGSDSPQANAARSHHGAVKAAEIIAAHTAEHGPFRPEDRALILATLDGMSPE